MIGSRVYGDAFVDWGVLVVPDREGCCRDICGELALCGNADLGRERDADSGDGDDVENDRIAIRILERQELDVMHLCSRYPRDQEGVRDIRLISTRSESMGSSKGS